MSFEKRPAMPIVHPQLPVEVIESEVLQRLPAKSVGRFRCVCKTWNSFLCSPDFARVHLRYNTKYKLLLLDQPTRTFRTLDCEPVNHDSITTRPIPFKDDHDVMILASLDGLVCVYFTSTRDLAFWNPLTGAYKKIRTNFVIDINGVFAFYADSSNDYKLIHLRSYSCDGFIYSQRLDSWRKIPCLENNIIKNIMCCQPIFSGEKVYLKLDLWREGPRFSLFSFDVESEKFEEIQFPPFPCDAIFKVNLVSLNGCVHLCVGYIDIPEGLKCDMWKMDGEEWIKVATFDNLRFYQPLKHIHIRRNGNWLAIWEDDDSFKNIDLEDYFKDLSNYSFLWRRDHEEQGVIYMETIVSPGVGQSGDTNDRSALMFS